MDWTDPMVNETKIVNHQEGRIHSWDWRKFILKKKIVKEIFLCFYMIKKKVKI